MWPVNTYVMNVTNVTSTEELKKNDKNEPRTKASFRNQESSVLKRKEKLSFHKTLKEPSYSLVHNFIMGESNIQGLHNNFFHTQLPMV